ncbi:hypothetical protein Tco_1304580 [Tanacetum coccineum]
MERYYQAFKCRCEKGDVVPRTSCKPYKYCKKYYACPCSKQRTQDNGCGYFIRKDDLGFRLSSSPGSSTPPSSGTFNTSKLFSETFWIYTDSWKGRVLKLYVLG